MSEPTRAQLARDYAAALAMISRLRSANDELSTQNAELLAACQGAVNAFDEWEGPEEDELPGQYAAASRARNTAVRAYEALCAVVAKAEGR